MNESAAARDVALDVVRRLRAAGFQALWAGGCVRDLLLGRKPKDFDVATDARPEQVRNLFGKRNTLAVGAAFGVIMVRDRGQQIEVATFRQDAEYLDGRHPSGVTFSDPRHDAERRDFTINGMFYDPLAEPADAIRDYVGGLADLSARVVRAIGHPRQRFHEDKLRMLRAVRFAAAFDFALDQGTAEAIRSMAAEVSVVSAERIASELERMLTHPRRAAALELLREVELLPVVAPEAAAEANLAFETAAGPDLWSYVLAVVERLNGAEDEQQPSWGLVLAALFHRACPEPAQAARHCAAACARWKLAHEHTDLAVWLVERQHALRGARAAPWPQLQRLLILPQARELVRLEGAVLGVLGQDTADLEHCRSILARPAAEWNPPPLIDGNDLLRLGVPRGPVYKELLDRVRDAQLAGQVRDKAEALALAGKLIPSKSPDAE